MRFPDLLLALVARRPSSGYQLKKWLDHDGVAIRANADVSQIYRSLHKLEEQGLLRHELTPSSDGPDAKYYYVTGAGAAHLHSLTERPYRPPARWQEPDFIAQLLLLGPLTPARVIDMIDRELTFRRDQQREQQEYRLPEEDGSGADEVGLNRTVANLLGDIVHDRQESTLADWLSWLGALRERWVETLQQQGLPLR